MRNNNKAYIMLKGIKILFISVLLINVLFISNAQKSNKSLLERSYRYKNSSLLREFFTQWHNEYTSISPEQFNLLNDTLKDIYTIFSDFYTPLNLQRVCGTNRYDFVYYGVDYVIIQDTISYAIIKTLNKKKLIDNYLKTCCADYDSIEYQERKQNYFNDTDAYYYNIEYLFSDSFFYKNCLRNFRPQVSVEYKTMLYSTSKYKTILDNFLKFKYQPFGIGNSAYAVKNSRKRMNWLNTKIHIYHGHWGGYWQTTTYPEAYFIFFDKERETAIVLFRVVYEGGQAFYKKINNKWVLIHSHLTWIE